MSTVIEEEESESRKIRAKNRELRLVYVTEDQAAVQKRKEDGSWGDAHILETEGSEAIDCMCPDSQMRGMKCYHQHAWEMWTFDKVVFSDGTVVDV